MVIHFFMLGLVVVAGLTPATWVLAPDGEILPPEGEIFPPDGESFPPVEATVAGFSDPNFVVGFAGLLSK